MVQSGKLPPVELRLPPNPVIVKPLDSVGKYGGTIRKVYTGVNDWWNLALFVCEGGTSSCSRSGRQHRPQPA
jgi:peptide/nickel transport system substrate-binding protein